MFKIENKTEITFSLFYSMSKIQLINQNHLKMGKLEIL